LLTFSPTFTSFQGFGPTSPDGYGIGYIIKLEVIDTALFIVCMDDSEPQDPAQLSKNMLCGTLELSPDGAQTGTCSNRWYDKLQIIVCANGAAGIKFEHTAADGHTVLR